MQPHEIGKKHDGVCCILVLLQYLKEAHFDTLLGMSVHSFTFDTFSGSQVACGSEATHTCFDTAPDRGGCRLLSPRGTCGRPFRR